MLINLAFIKATNGLFYFALDYIAALDDAISAILVRTDEQAAVLRERAPEREVRIVTPWQAALLVCAAGRRGEMTFTPSSHPIPACARQMVVVHDTFPFEGRKGAVKAVLFLLTVRIARAHVGYINRSDAKAFLVRGGVPAARLHSAPNHMILSDRGARAILTLSDQVSVGLLGTDSPKKNYHALFAALAGSPAAHRLRLVLYGQPNTYADTLIERFPSLAITICDSRTRDLNAFVRSVDLLASAATQEGFSRPIAAALADGVPCWIVDAPVFREFYEGAARFYGSIGELAASLLALTPGTSIERPDYQLPPSLHDDFRTCVGWLRKQDFTPS
jgi:hypothetical protein